MWTTHCLYWGQRRQNLPFPKTALRPCLCALFLSLGLPLPGSWGHPGHSGPTKSLLSSFWLILHKLWAGTLHCQLCAPSSWWAIRRWGPPRVASGCDWGRLDCTPGIHLALCWVTARGLLGNDIIPQFLSDMPFQINLELHSPLLSALSNHWSFLLPWCSYLPQEFCRKLLSLFGDFLISFSCAHSTSVYPSDMNSNGIFSGNLCYLTPPRLNQTPCDPHE